MEDLFILIASAIIGGAAGAALTIWYWQRDGDEE